MPLKPQRRLVFEEREKEPPVSEAGDWPDCEKEGGLVLAYYHAEECNDNSRTQGESENAGDHVVGSEHADPDCDAHRCHPQ